MTHSIKAKSFPDLAKQFKAMKLADELVQVTINEKSLIGLSIYNALEIERLPVSEVFKTIKEQAKDNFKLMADVIGETLLNDILNF
jgi:hypothetical protein